MQLSKGPQDRIKEYLDEVSCHMGDMPSEERTDTLQYLKEHIDDSLGKLDVDSPTIEDLETVISEMASPDSYGQEKVEGEKKPGFLLPIVLVLYSGNFNLYPAFNFSFFNKGNICLYVGA